VTDVGFLKVESKRKTYGVLADTYYETCSACQLVPGELRDIRDYLLSFGDLYHFQIWVMILAGVKMFLRCNDVSINIDIVNFLQIYFVYAPLASQVFACR
jgi:hypothetical protein